jgi:hypothetical protein
VGGVVGREPRAKVGRSGEEDWLRKWRFRGHARCVSRGYFRMNKLGERLLIPPAQNLREISYSQDRRRGFDFHSTCLVNEGHQSLSVQVPPVHAVWLTILTT